MIVSPRGSVGTGADEVSDEALVRASAAGDEAAFARLVRRYLRKAMAVATEYVGSRADAEDVVQESWRRVVGGLAGFDARRPFEPWFFTIVRNTARNAVRSGRRHAHDELGPERPSAALAPDEAAQRAELRARIHDALGRLPPMQATCFRLCAVEGLSSAEAAAATGVAESTVRVHLFRARRALRSLLHDWREEGDEG